MTPTPEDVIHTHGKVITLRPERVLTFGKFRVQNAEDFEAPLIRPSIVKGIFHPRELSVWYGEPGCGKTFLLTYICYCSAIGREVFGRRVPAGGADTLFVEMEGGGFYRRLEALRREFGATPQFHFATQSVSLFSNEDAVRDLIAAAKATKAKLIAIDTLSRAMAGGDENGPADMTRFVGILDHIKEATDAAIAIIHHSGKNLLLGARGHNSLKGAADVEVEVTRGDNGERQGRIVKARDDADGQTLAFKLKVVELARDQDGDAVTTCTVEEIGQARVPTAKLTATEVGWLRDISDAINEPGWADERVHLGVDFSVPRALSRDRLRAWLCKKGRLDSKEGEALSATDRSTLRKYLNSLRDKRRIGISGDWIWLI